MLIDIFFSSDFLQKYVVLTAISLISAYLIAVFSYYVVHKRLLFSGFRFSHRNYHIMMVPFIFPPLFIGFLDGTWVYLLIFLYFGIAGVMGEIIFSILWKCYFRNPFWKYKFFTIVNKSSSLLNFIPWGVGGFMYLSLTSLYTNNFGNIFYEGMDKEQISFLFLKAAAIFVLQILLFKMVSKIFPLRKMFDKKKRIIIKYIYFISSFFLIGFLMPINYFHYLFLFFLYGIIAFIVEYFFGKISKLIIGKKLWTYEYLTIDKKHTTLLNIVVFGLGGYYFIFLFLLLHHLV